MKIFADTAEVQEIQSLQDLGIIDGVTTNPSLIAKSGRDIREVLAEICAICPGDISGETVASEADGMIREGRWLRKIADNMVVKVPLTPAGIRACKTLSEDGHPVNVTLCFSANQALLAAKAGARYISPFVGRLDAVGHVGMDLVRQIKTIYDQYQLTTQVLVAAIRHPTHVLEAALVGADVCTMNYDVMKQLYDHPLTEAGIQMFLDDWKKVPQDMSQG